MKDFRNMLHTVAACAIASLAVACSGDEATENNQSGLKETITLTAYTGSSRSETRLGFNSLGKAYWHDGDKIGVWSNGEAKFNPFIIIEGAGTGTASFRGDVVGGAGSYAVYPYNEKHSLEGDVLSYCLPDSYTYTEVGQSIVPSDKKGNSFRNPMIGIVTDDNTVSFKHLGGVICLQIDKMPAESGTVTVTDETNRLSGTFTATLTDATPELQTASSTDRDTVTFTYSNAKADGIGVFYLPVATGSYTLEIKVSGGGKWSVTSAKTEVKRTGVQIVNVETRYNADGSTTINGHKFVDLGLPSGVLWAEANIGAALIGDAGNYYAWGETETKESFGSDTYKYSGVSIDTFTKRTGSNGSVIELKKENDAAYVNWGAPCRMPTKEECAELANTENCTWSLTQAKTSDGEGVRGYIVKSTKNDNYIFLPLCGWKNGSTLNYYQYEGHYLSNMLEDELGINAYTLYFTTNNFQQATGGTDFGMAVRPVCKP